MSWELDGEVFAALRNPGLIATAYQHPVMRTAAWKNGADLAPYVQGHQGDAMDFPAAVRTRIASMIEGDSWAPMGWVESLACAERDFNPIEEAIKIKTQRSEIE